MRSFGFSKNQSEHRRRQFRRSSSLMRISRYPHGNLKRYSRDKSKLLRKLIKFHSSLIPSMCWEATFRNQTETHLTTRMGFTWTVVLGLGRIGHNAFSRRKRNVKIRLSSSVGSR